MELRNLKHFTRMRILLFYSLFALLFFGCKKTEDSPEDPVIGKASFRIENTTYKTAPPYLGVVNDNGTLLNTLVMDVADGTEIEINFSGNSPASLSIPADCNAYYRNSEGVIYSSVNGQLLISEYTSNGNIYRASGNFHFKAKISSSPNDSLEITDGIFVNASNE